MPVPTPKKGESKEDFIARFMSNVAMKDEYTDQKQRIAVAHSTWRNKNKESSDWHVIEFSAPIQENAFVNDEFIIKGIAINETTTHNGHKYIAEELEPASKTLIGKPLLIDHNNSVEAIKGTVSKSFWNSTARNVQFEAKIMDKTIREMVKDGRIKNVSIGAFAQDLVKDEDSDSYIAKGIKFAELSLVAVPADEGATFAMAFAKNYALKEALWQSETEIPLIEMECPECGKKFEDKKKMRKHMSTHEDEDEEAEESYLPKVKKSLKGGLGEEMTEINSVEIEQLKTELAKLKEEKRLSLVEKYNSLCKEKSVKALETSKLSEEMIHSLIEQVSDIKIVSTELKSQVTPKVNIEGLDNFVFERYTEDTGKPAFWVMPDSKGRIAVKKWQ